MSRPVPYMLYPQRAVTNYSLGRQRAASRITPASARSSVSLSLYTPFQPQRIQTPFNHQFEPHRIVSSTTFSQSARHLHPAPQQRPQHQGSDRTFGSGSRPFDPREKLRSRDRGPPSKEDTQTDFGQLNVLGSIAAPTTSVDTCLFDGFQLDSGLHVGEGDGVVLVGGEGFVWRPWMAKSAITNNAAGVSSGPADVPSSKNVINGNMMVGETELDRTGGVLNKSGQFEVAEDAWGIFDMLWPRPDLLIIGTGRTIRPLAPSTRAYLQTLGMRLEVLDTRNAASQFNMLATERGVTEVAAALVPIGFGIK